MNPTRQIYQMSVTATSGAQANGIDKNTATIKITDESGVVSGVNINVFLSGSALFSNGKNMMTDATQINGNLTVDFTDTEGEVVTVYAQSVSNPDIQGSTTSSFEGQALDADQIYLEVEKDNSKADGMDTNIVSVSSLSAGEPVPNTSIGVSLTNGAVFINGQSNATIKTDAYGTAKATFTNTRQGNANFNAYLPDNISVANSVITTFIDPTTDMEMLLNLTANTDGALANGIATNQLTAHIRNKDTLEVIPFIDVLFTVSGSATFAENGLSVIEQKTNLQGECDISIKNLVSESVMVEAHIPGHPEASDNYVSTFNEDYSPLIIKRVYNGNNLTFADGHPTVSFKNALITLETEGGSGDISWSLNSMESSALHLEGNGSKAQLVILSKTRYPFSVVAHDNITGEEVIREFAIQDHIYTYGESISIHVINISGNSKYLPSIDLMKDLYKQWGNLTLYPDWLRQGEAWSWTDEFNLLGLGSTIFSLVNGTTDTVLDTFKTENFVGVDIN